MPPMLSVLASTITPLRGGELSISTLKTTILHSDNHSLNEKRLSFCVELQLSALMTQTAPAPGYKVSRASDAEVLMTVIIRVEAETHIDR